MFFRNSQHQVLIVAVIISFWSCSPKKEDQTKSPEKEVVRMAAEPALATNPDSLGVSRSRLIVPGKSIGLTTLQEKAELVIVRLGKPDQSDAAMGKALATWFSKAAANFPDTTRHQTTIYFKTNMGKSDEASRVDQIRVTSPYFLTSDSIHVRSDLAAIKKAFPELRKVAAYTSPQNAAKVIIYDAAAAGIAFEINKEDRCVAITVHAPNQEIKNTYLPLFPNLEKL